MRHSHTTPHAAPGQGGAYSLPRRSLRDATKVVSMSDSETLRRKLRTDVDMSGQIPRPADQERQPAKRRKAHGQSTPTSNLVGGGQT
jgi:hypothetical protein